MSISSNIGAKIIFKMLTYIIQEYIKKNSTPWPSRVYSKDVIWLINKNLMYEVSQKDKDHYSILTHIYGI